MDHHEQMKELEKALPNMHSRDQRFGISLLDQWKRRGGLSDKQWPYVAELLGRTGVMVPDSKPAPTRRQIEVGSLTRINELFDSAVESGIQYPKIRFLMSNDETVVLARAGKESKWPGTINVKCDGVWHGRIDREGIFTENPSAPIPSHWLKEIKELSENPAEAMKAQGRRTGNCCLCGRELTNHESIELGIGPVCASNWGVG